MSTSSLILIFLSSSAALAEPPSLSASLAEFNRSTEGAGRALAELSGTECLSSSKLQSRLREVAARGTMVTTYTNKLIAALEARVAKPMESPEAQACRGSFQTLAQEITARKELLGKSRENLLKAAEAQAEVIDALDEVRSVDSPSQACIAFSIKRLQTAESTLLDSLIAMAKVDLSLMAHENAMERYIAFNSKRRAACGGQPGSMISAQVKASQPAGEREHPRAASQRGRPSQITGLKEDSEKRGLRPDAR